MKVLVAYATSEGHTRQVARRITDRLADGGKTIELLSLKDADDIDLRRFDRIIVAAPIHAGHYPRPLTDFAAKYSAALHDLPTLFVSSSLSAAGHDADDWKDLDRILKDFQEATGWTPGAVYQIAGAYLPSQYDIFRRFIMRQIISLNDPATDPSRDKIYTDWGALDDFIATWLTE